MLLQRSTTGVSHALLRFPNKRSPLALLWFLAQNRPSCTMWFRQFTKNVIKTDHKEWSHPHSTEHDTQPTTYLISKQVAPYRTHGGTCCPAMSSPKIWSLADLSMTNHIIWRNPTVSPFQPCSNHSIDPHNDQITSRWMGDLPSQRHKRNSISQRIERLVRHSWLHG
jgi:hypothetical protein